MKATEARKNGTKTMSATVKLPNELLNLIDRRCRDLDLSRSQYFRRLARRDLDENHEAA